MPKKDELGVKVINTKRELALAMRENQITRNEVAAALDVTTQCVWKWLQGLAPVPRYAGLWFYHTYGIHKKSLKKASDMY